jgi:hypothetical protein
MPTTTIKLSKVSTLDTEPPAIPDGATDWERQELRRCWSNALSALHDVTSHAARLHQRVAVATQPDHPTIGGGGLTYRAMQADAAMVEFHARYEGVVHRLALAAKAAEVQG